MVVDAGDSIDACDSKTARNSALFSCLLGYRVGDELAVVMGIGGCETMLLGVGGLV